MSVEGQGPATAVHRILDHQHRAVAAVFQHPPEWRAESQVVWNFAHYSLPVKVFGRVFDPQGTAALEFFPVEWFCWIDPYVDFRQPGQDLNDGMFLLQPMSAADTLTRWVIPKYRGGWPGLRTLGARPVPRLAESLGAGVQQGAASEGAAARVEYADQGGRAFEEEFFGLRVAFPGIPTYGAAGCLTQYNWGFTRLFSFRAEAGRLDAERDRLWSVVHSLKVNPEWERLCAGVFQRLKQQFDQYIQAGYDQIAAATRLSQQISAQNQAWLDSQQQRREAASRADEERRRRERSSAGAYTAGDAFGDYIMGRETYEDAGDPTGSSQHGYYNYVWTDGQQNYEYSDDANFDPNVGSDRTWTPMRKRRVGE